MARLALTLLFIFSGAVALAQATPEPPKLTAEETLEALFQHIKQTPQNLDLNFSYAQLATQLGRYDEALAAYERMLFVRQDLHRVKLDMAAIYSTLGNIDKAEALLGEVLAINPPEPVKENIQKALTELGTRRQRHSLSGSLTVGWYADSNGNAAPASGNQDVLGISVPLGVNSLEATDDQIFSALSVRHGFRFSGPSGHTWQTEGLYYKTKQASLSALDITLKSIKTGPVWVFPKLNSRIGLSFQYTDTNLDHVDYQQTIRKQLEWTYVAHPKLQLQLTGNHDLKRHHNSASSSLYTLRNGEAWEGKASATYAYSPKTSAILSYTFHQEQANAQYYSYDARTLDAKLLHQLPWYDVSAILGASVAQTAYRAPDTSVNPNDSRVDNLRSWSLLLSKAFTPTLNFTAGYTYKDVSSNIQNYAYENERWSAAFTKRF